MSDIKEEVKINNLGDLMYESDPCVPNLVLNKIKAARLHTEKVKIIQETINKCSMKAIKKIKKKTGVKRQMSGYNLYMKECAIEKDFGTCLQERGWSTLSATQKEEYNKRAREL